MTLPLPFRSLARLRPGSILAGSILPAWIFRCWIVGVGIALGSAGLLAAQESLLGFRADHAAAQLELEQRLDADISASEMLGWVERMTPRPHHTGAPQTKANAEWMLQQFRAWGFDASIEEYQVLIPQPKVRRLELLEPTRFTARLQEDVLAGDSTSAVAVAEGLPPYNAYSADGDVTAEVVYVNQGVPADYEQLERLGIDVAGKIVLARYGGSWRGIKPKVAAEHGAVACLIYNDPRDDGYFQGETYPEGPFKHDRGVQRGSVLDLPLRPGDPLTPMRGATADAERLDLADAETLMKIPVLPLSWRDAQPLLEALAGPVAPADWRGALPITYRIGPGPAKVRLQLEFDWGLRPAYNVIARVEGSERPDQWVLRGNHHDAWVIGARDPISGLIALLAEAKAVGAQLRSGWRPRRTLVYAAWDAEEPGLLGSTEWVEHHARELDQKAVAYINTDGNSRGFLSVGGSHAFQQLVNEVARAVEDPQTGVSVGERLRAARMVRGAPDAADKLRRGAPFEIAALGSGSDYSPFFQHLGVSSLNVGFGGEGSGGEYHTAFDSWDFYRRFVDPGGAYGAALAKVGVRLTLRLANADVLPFDFTATTATIAGYIDEVMELAVSERRQVERSDHLAQSGAFELAADPTKTFVAPAVEGPVPHLDFSPLLNARDELQRRTEAWDGQWPTWLQDGVSADFDRAVFQVERLFTHEEGLPRRPWFRHHIYAPGFYTGYGVKTLPGVREAIEEHDWEGAQQQIHIVARILTAFAQRLEGMTE